MDECGPVSGSCPGKMIAKELRQAQRTAFGFGKHCRCWHANHTIRHKTYSRVFLQVTHVTAGIDRAPLYLFVRRIYREDLAWSMKTRKAKLACLVFINP